MNTINETFSEGQRISVRGEDFFITGVKPSDNGRHLLQAKGLSELVRDQEFIFEHKVLASGSRGSLHRTERRNGVK